MHQLEAKGSCVLCTTCGDFEYFTTHKTKTWKDDCGRETHTKTDQSRITRMKADENWTTAMMWQLRTGLPMDWSKY